MGLSKDEQLACLEDLVRDGSSSALLAAQAIRHEQHNTGTDFVIYAETALKNLLAKSQESGGQDWAHDLVHTDPAVSIMAQNELRYGNVTPAAKQTPEDIIASAVTSFRSTLNALLGGLKQTGDESNKALAGFLNEYFIAKANTVYARDPSLRFLHASNRQHTDMDPYKYEAASRKSVQNLLNGMVAEFLGCVVSNRNAIAAVTPDSLGLTLEDVFNNATISAKMHLRKLELLPSDSDKTPESQAKKDRIKQTLALVENLLKELVKDMTDSLKAFMAGQEAVAA
jgi:hypothetical protein